MSQKINQVLDQSEQVSYPSEQKPSSHRSSMSVDQQLLQLLIELVNIPANNKDEKNRVINRILALIPKLPGIRKPNTDTEDLAFSQTLQYLARHITQLANSLAVEGKSSDEEAEEVREKIVNWFNRNYKTILKRRKIDNIRSSTKGDKPIVSLDKSIIFEEDNKTTKLDKLGDHKPSPMEDLEERDLIEKIKEHINKDAAFDSFPKCNIPKNLIFFVVFLLVDQDLHLLEKIFVIYRKNRYHKATCREIIKRRFLTDPPQEWKELAQDLNIPYGTVTAHYNRKCLKLLDNLKNQF
ncbi:MAG TPA: hypothetical protein V6C58_25910 [Allocoleopsis sp.]